MDSSWNVLDGPKLDGPEIFLKKMRKSINEIWTFSNSSTSYPIITKKIQIAPLRGASGIEIIIIG